LHFLGYELVACHAAPKRTVDGDVHPWTTDRVVQYLNNPLESIHYSSPGESTSVRGPHRDLPLGDADAVREADVREKRQDGHQSVPTVDGSESGHRAAAVEAEASATWATPPSDGRASNLECSGRIFNTFMEIWQRNDLLDQSPIQIRAVWHVWLPRRARRIVQFHVANA
jgi:hypothetical protein